MIVITETVQTNIDLGSNHLFQNSVKNVTVLSLSYENNASPTKYWDINGKAFQNQIYLIFCEKIPSAL